MASQTMEMAALGRPFTLGMLYDARDDKLVPGVKLWNDKTMQAYIQESRQQTSKVTVVSSDSIEDKSSQFNVEGSLKVSFLSGLIEVGGSAKYLNDQKKHLNQSRVTVKYSSTTTFKQLGIDCLEEKNKQQQSVIKQGLATHFVTAIQYGANAVFVFDSEMLDDESVSDIHGSMTALLEKMSISGKMDARVQLNDTEKNTTKKFSCKFFGDFLLDCNPTTFDEAVKTIAKLPGFLGEKRENSVPIKVWLMPLTVLNPDVPQLVKEISEGLLDDIQNTLNMFRELVMWCNDCLEDRKVKTFPQIKQKMKNFQSLCNRYTARLKRTLAETLPAIRKGKQPESLLRKTIQERENSPFSTDQLKKWRKCKKAEISVIKTCLEKIECTTVKIVADETQLEREAFARGVEDALCFDFTFVEGGDAYLKVLDDYLQSSKSGNTIEVKGYLTEKVKNEIYEKAEEFHNLAKALRKNSRYQFLVAAIANKKYKGATIYHYRKNSLVTDNFTKPDISDVTAVKARRDLLWYAYDLTLNPDSASCYLQLSEENKKATCAAWQQRPDSPSRFDNHCQVMCNEGLTGRHYWEVEWSNGDSDEVGIAVAYDRIGRKGSDQVSRLGHNDVSWYFGHRYGLYAWHRAQACYGPHPQGDCRKIGVYLDKPAGTLSFYRISSDRLHHLYTFKARFTEDVYPAIWIWVTNNFVYLSPFK